MNFVRGLKAAGLKVEGPHTNMVFAQVPAESVAALKQHVEQNGIVALVGAKLRLVTHLDVGAADIDRAVEVFAKFFQKAAAAA